MGEYLKTWGIDYHAERVAGDVLRGERVKGGDGRYRVYPLWFWAKGEDGRPLRFHTPGSLLAAENFADLHFSELAATGGQSGDIAAEKIRYASKTQVILDYNQDNKKRVLALLAEGKFRSHYRGGILDKAKSAQPYLPFAVRDAAVAVVADSDFAAVCDNAVNQLVNLNLVYTRLYPKLVALGLSLVCLLLLVPYYRKLQKRAIMGTAEAKTSRVFSQPDAEDIFTFDK